VGELDGALVDVVVPGQHEIDLLGHQQVEDVCPRLTAIFTDGQARFVHPHDDPRNSLGTGTVDRGGRPGIPSGPSCIRPRAVGERDIRRNHHEPDKRRFSRDVNVILAAIGADQARQLIG